MLTEDEIRQIWDDTVFDHADKGDVAWDGVRQVAPAAIAERLSEGVVFEDVFKAKGFDDHIRLTNGAGDAEFRTTDGGLDNDGRMYRVTVKIVEGTKDAGED